MKKLSLLCAALLLSACNSSSNNHDTPPPAGGGVITPPAAVVDAFYTTVGQYLSPTGEETDSTPIDAVVATQPEDTEPSELT